MSMPANGGFLASWAPPGDWSGTPTDGQGMGATLQESRDRPHTQDPLAGQFNFGQTSDFQQAGGSGGGFTNFAQWLYANQGAKTQDVAKIQQTPEAAQAQPSTSSTDKTLLNLQNSSFVQRLGGESALSSAYTKMGAP